MKKICFSAFLLMVSPAFAHLGEHAGLDIAALASHFFEWDHLLFAAASVLIGWASFKAGKRSEALAALSRKKSHDPR